MPDYELVGQQVRVVWKEEGLGAGRAEITIFRGQVLKEADKGLWLWGRLFWERAEMPSRREYPKDKDPEMRIYFAPWTSISSIEIIEAGTKQFEIHQMVLNRKATTQGTPPPAEPKP